MWMIESALGHFGLGDSDAFPEWMGFTEVREDINKKKAEGSQWLADPFCMSKYHDRVGRQWCLLSKHYDYVSWGGLVPPSQKTEKFGIAPGRVQNSADVIMDPAFAGDVYSPELYENAAHVLGTGARWRLNTGPGYFCIRLHLLDWWHGGDRRFYVVLSSGGNRCEHLVCTPENRFARIDELFLEVEAPATTMELQIIRDDSLDGDSFPCFSGFEVQRMTSDGNVTDQDTAVLLQSTHLYEEEIATQLEPPARVEKSQPRLQRRPKTSNAPSQRSEGTAERTTALKAMPSSVRRSRSTCKMESIDAQNTSVGRSSAATPSAKSKTVQPKRQARSLSRTNGKVQGETKPQAYALPNWNLMLSDPPRGFFGHPDEPNDTRIFQCIVRPRDDKGGSLDVVGLLALPQSSSCRGLVITCPGAGGGQGPADPEGSGGGGTYGAYNVYGRLAAELSKQGIAVVLAHYPDGAPLRPLEGGIPQTIEHVEALLAWARDYLGNPQVPVAMVGWSMGGAVVIEAGARAVKSRSVNLCGVATIASMKEVSIDAPKTIVESSTKLLLMHNVEGRCTGLNSQKIAKLAGGKVKPVLFPGENHGVKSAFGELQKWFPTVFNGSKF